MNAVFPGPGGLVGEARPEGGSARAFVQHLPSSMGINGNNDSLGSSGQVVHGEPVTGPGQSADQPIELDSDDEKIEDALSPSTANQ